MTHPLCKNPNFISNNIQCLQSPSRFPIPKLLNESAAYDNIDTRIVKLRETIILQQTTEQEE